MFNIPAAAFLLALLTYALTEWPLGALIAMAVSVGIAFGVNKLITLINAPPGT